MQSENWVVLYKSLCTENKRIINIRGQPYGQSWGVKSAITNKKVWLKTFTKILNSHILKLLKNLYKRINHIEVLIAHTNLIIFKSLFKKIKNEHLVARIICQLDANLLSFTSFAL